MAGLCSHCPHPSQAPPQHPCQSSGPVSSHQEQLNSQSCCRLTPGLVQEPPHEQPIPALVESAEMPVPPATPAQPLQSRNERIGAPAQPTSNFFFSLADEPDSSADGQLQPAPSPGAAEDIFQYMPTVEDYDSNALHYTRLPEESYLPEDASGTESCYATPHGGQETSSLPSASNSVSHYDGARYGRDAGSNKFFLVQPHQVRPGHTKQHTPTSHLHAVCGAGLRACMSLVTPVLGLPWDSIVQCPIWEKHSIEQC